jgi:hypothetical protein
VLVVAVFGAYDIATRTYALGTWLLHGHGEVFYWGVLIVLWGTRPAEALIRGGVRGVLHAAIGVGAWGVALHWLYGVQLADRADDRYAVLMVTLPAIVLFRMGLSPWLIRRWLRGALTTDARMDGWFGSWQQYVGESLNGPLVVGAVPRVAKHPVMAPTMGAFDRALMGRAPRLPALVRQEVAIALDTLLAGLVTKELDGHVATEAVTKDSVASEVVSRFEADCEAGLHAVESPRIRMLRLEAVGYASARFLLDTEDEEVVRRFRDAAINVAVGVAAASEKVIYEKLQQGEPAARLFPELVRSASSQLDAPGIWRALFAMDLYRQGFASWALWLMEAGGHDDKNASNDARHALTGAVLARRMRDDTQAGEYDRIQWLARGAMNLAKAGGR